MRNTINIVIAKSSDLVGHRFVRVETRDNKDRVLDIRENTLKSEHVPTWLATTINQICHEFV